MYDDLPEPVLVPVGGDARRSPALPSYLLRQPSEDVGDYVDLHNPAHTSLRNETGLVAPGGRSSERPPSPRPVAPPKKGSADEDSFSWSQSYNREMNTSGRDLNSVRRGLFTTNNDEHNISFSGAENTGKGWDTSGRGLDTSAGGLDTSGRGLNTSGRGQNLSGGLDTSEREMNTTGRGRNMSGRGLSTSGRVLETSGRELNSSGSGHATKDTWERGQEASDIGLEVGKTSWLHSRNGSDVTRVDSSSSSSGGNHGMRQEKLNFTADRLHSTIGRSTGESSKSQNPPVSCRARHEAGNLNRPGTDGDGTDSELAGVGQKVSVQREQIIKQLGITL